VTPDLIYYFIVSGTYDRCIVGTFDGPTQPPIQWIHVPLSLGIKGPGREADNLPPSCSEIKNAWSYTSTPIHLHGVVLS